MVCRVPGAAVSGLTTDPNDPDVVRGPPDTTATPQHAKYLVLSDEERAKGFVRPYRDTYVHLKGCGAKTTMGRAIAETYAREPGFYGATYCAGCLMHRPVGADGEFVWDGTTERGGP